MRQFSVIAALAVAASLSGCDDTRVIATPSPAPTASPNTNGECRDGTVTSPDVKCP
jgi:hypothetical protein